jgi:hypothetical protein
MTNHEIAVLMAWAFGLIWLGMIAQITIRVLNEKPQDNNDLQGQNSLPVPRPFGKFRAR